MKKANITQQGKARLYFALIVFINLAILLVIITGIIFGVKGYISDSKLTYKAITCCGSICSKCLFTFRTLATVLPWVCITMLFIGIGMAIHKTIFFLSWNYSFGYLATISIKNNFKLKKILSRMHVYNHVVLLDNDVLRGAFTTGLWKPKVYLSLGLCSYLTKKELKAVILHEMHHKKSKDPLKLFVVQILHALNFFLPINDYLFNLYHSASEKAADDSAINFSKEPLELVSALVKIAKSYKTLLHPLALSFKGQNIIEDRIRRLLEPHIPSPYFGNTRLYFSCLLTVFIAVTIHVTLFYKLFQSSQTIWCKTRICHMIKCG